MGASGRMEWDRVSFVSYISVECNVQTVTIDKKKRMLQLEEGYAELKKVEIPLTEELLNKVEQCFEEMKICEWMKWNYNPSLDGERWSFEFYRRDEMLFCKNGFNAYPEGYGKWLELYTGLFLDNGMEEIHTCYRKEREGCILGIKSMESNRYGE